MNFLGIDYQKRVYGLDVFRAVAILLVVQGHSAVFVGRLLEIFPAIPLMDGVELFFVLSGFLIGSILIKSVEKENGLSFSSLLSFWKKRWFRTLPNYYLILFINFLLVKYGIINGDIQQFSYKFIFFIQNFSEGFYDFFWESWSLSIEEWFYIFLPIFIFGFLLFLKKKTALLWAIISLIVLPLIYRISISEATINSFWWDVNFRKVVLTRLDAIVYGVLAAFAKFYYPVFWTKYKNGLFILGLLIIYGNQYFPHNPNDFYSKTFSFSVTSIGAALLVAKADSVKQFKNKYIGKGITFISIISYSMYLVNLALVAQVISKNVPLETKAAQGVFYAIYWGATILISTLIYKFFEKPILQWRDKKW